MRQKIIISGKGVIRCRLDEGGNSMLFIYNRQGQPLGYYQQVLDKTYSISGQYIGPGDQRMTLVDDHP